MGGKVAAVSVAHRAQVGCFHVRQLLSRTSSEQLFQLVQQTLHISQSGGHVVGIVPILVGINVQVFCNGKQLSDLIVAGLGHQPRGRVIQRDVAPMRPSAPVSNGFDHLGRCAPAFLGRRADIASRKLAFRLSEQTTAGLSVGLHYHRSVLKECLIGRVHFDYSGCRAFVKITKHCIFDHGLEIGPVIPLRENTVPQRPGVVAAFDGFGHFEHYLGGRHGTHPERSCLEGWYRGSLTVSTKN